MSPSSARRASRFPLPLLFLLPLLGIPCASGQQPAGLIEQGIETRRIVSEFQHYLQDTIMAYTPGLAVAIVDGNSTSYINTYGIRRLGASEAVDAHTTFRLASLSKAFAAATAGILVTEGSLSWEDKLSRYVPALRLKDPEYQEVLSVRHILSNSTGLLPHAYTNLVEDNVPYEKIVQKLDAVDFVCSPGACYTYQNVAYSFIGDILQNVTGKDYRTLVAEKIFTPLQMTDASVTLEDFVANQNHASPHERRRRTLTPTEVKGSYYTIAPAAGVNASISDMERWLQALLGHHPHVLPPEVLNELYTGQTVVREPGYYRGAWQNVKGTWYGLGWRVFDYAGTPIAYHGGWVQGYHAEIVLIPSLGLGMAVLMNSDYTNGQAVVPRFLDITLGLKSPLPPAR